MRRQSLLVWCSALQSVPKDTEGGQWFKIPRGQKVWDYKGSLSFPIEKAHELFQQNGETGAKLSW